MVELKKDSNRKKVPENKNSNKIGDIVEKTKINNKKVKDFLWT